MGGLTALALVVVAYTLVASKLDRWWITGAHGVRRRRGDPWSWRVGSSPLLAGQRDGPYHHRADLGSVVVLGCLHGPVAGGRGRCRPAPPVAVRRAAALDRFRGAAGPPGVSRGRVGGGRLGRYHPGPDRRGARSGGGDQHGRSGADPTSAECRERPQRRDRDAAGHLVHRYGRRRGGASATRHGGWRRSSRSGWPSSPRSWSAISAGSCWRSPTSVGGPRRFPSRSPSWPWRCSPTRERSRSAATGSLPRSPGASCSGPPPAGAWQSRSSSPRPSDCWARFWCGRSSVRCLLASCAPAASRRSPSSTPC